MLTTKYLSLRVLVSGALLFGALAPAHAQYSWIDAKGMRVFSDRPPPPDTPAARILKAPRAAATAPYGSPAAPAPAPTPAEAPKPALPTTAEREAAYRARAAQQKEEGVKTAKKAQQEDAQAERCKILKRNQATLASGTRIAEVDDKGQSGFLSDAERTLRQAKAQQALAAECP